MKRKKGSKYTEQFREDVLSYWANTQETAEQVAAHFGVTTYSLYNWRRKQADDLPLKEGHQPEETPEQELRRLRRENRQLQMQAEILKKTVIIMGGPAKNVSN
jgi:transposase